jgi:hypothetical protein
MQIPQISPSGGALPHIFCIHVHSGPIYWGAIYLAEKIIRYGIFQKKVNTCTLIHPINIYKFFGGSFKNILIYLYYIFILILQVSNSFEYASVMATAVATTVYPLNFRRQIGTQRPSTTTKNIKTLNPKFSRVQKELPPASHNEKEPP